MYVAGEVTEVVVEIVATGGGAALRHVATRTVRRGLEGGAVTAFRRKIGEVRGGFVHHINPIKGHPAIKDRPNQIARYPLPFKWSARGHWNMRHYRNADDHLWAHQRMLYAEAVDRLRESTILIRQAANELFLWMEGSRPCYDDWSIEIRAYVFGEIFAGLVNAGFPPVGSPHFIDVVAQMEDLER
jgi:hypothetical protein